ncbi:hypothetical protein VNO77_20572 [Canavalia gladiata]|uniref:Uncharacterized protein n=1 Tax=Canavalia gladiata TaxID=3824 RepID=A0AAN9LPT2_CANGL
MPPTMNLSSTSPCKIVISPPTQRIPTPLKTKLFKSTNNKAFARHKDTIRTSDVQWMTASSAIVHSEMLAKASNKGLQLLINLSAHIFVDFLDDMWLILSEENEDLHLFEKWRGSKLVEN